MVGVDAKSGSLSVGFPYEDAGEGGGPPKVAGVAHLISVPTLAKRMASAFQVRAKKRSVSYNSEGFKTLNDFRRNFSRLPGWPRTIPRAKPATG